MSEFDYNDLSEAQKAIYDNAYNMGWSRAAESLDIATDVVFEPTNAEELYPKNREAFTEGYKAGVSAFTKFNQESI